ncbi:MAG: hypothetical protein EON93_13985 [Burkholderiales bacterium]|nr:MAG: hypothetical protein EON93_13985 [Burkholderiales bacterium]
METLRTPDGRYLIVRGRLWRTANPNLSEDECQTHVDALMAARRAVKVAKAGNPEELAKARAKVNAAKVALGERGPVWWRDGTKDYNRYLVRNTPYAEWYAQVSGQQA